MKDFKITINQKEENVLDLIDKFTKFSSLYFKNEERIANIIFEVWNTHIKSDIKIVEPVYRTLTRTSQRIADYFYLLVKGYLKKKRLYDRFKVKLGRIERNLKYNSIFNS